MARPSQSAHLARIVPVVVLTATLLTVGAGPGRHAAEPPPAHPMGSSMEGSMASGMDARMDARMGASMDHSMGMTEESMRQTLAAWYRAHPAHGAAATGPAADTFRVVNYRFDNDGNTFTQVDTAHIVAGQSILWKWVIGSHTTTSGSPDDPSPGELWDQPSDAANPEFEYTFDTPGVYPFFCVLHGTFAGMRGVVVVDPNPLGVPPSAGEAGRAFLSAPWPNPTRAGASFRFGIDRAGPVRLSVFDVSGREVARVIDASLPPGTYVGAWNGRQRDGTSAMPGTYFVRLVSPGQQARARVVVSR
jgi:plastocyanin